MPTAQKPLEAANLVITTEMLCKFSKIIYSQS